MIDLIFCRHDGYKSNVIHVQEVDYPYVRDALFASGGVDEIQVRDSGMGIWSIITYQQWTDSRLDEN